MEFTGNYNRCYDCKHIYDYEDVCPECGSGAIEDLNANEIKEIAENTKGEEAYMLYKMLELHGDYVTKRATENCNISDINNQRELLILFYEKLRDSNQTRHNCADKEFIERAVDSFIKYDL
jgi:hypothetical protein